MNFKTLQIDNFQHDPNLILPKPDPPLYRETFTDFYGKDKRSKYENTNINEYEKSKKYSHYDYKATMAIRVLPIERLVNMQEHTYPICDNELKGEFLIKPQNLDNIAFNINKT